MYWLEWRCHRITVAGALNNDKKKKLSPQSVLNVKWQWKQRCLQFPAKTATMLWVYVTLRMMSPSSERVMSVCSSACKRDNFKSCGWILIKFRGVWPAIDRLDAKHLHTREDAPGTLDPRVRFDVELLNFAKTRLWKGKGSARSTQVCFVVITQAVWLWQSKPWVDRADRFLSIVEIHQYSNFGKSGQKS